MAQKPIQSLNVPKKGMSRKNPIELENTEYSFAMNANMENSSEDFFSLSNEQSNILATKFKDGFKVIGFKGDTYSNSTYFLLTNPTTGVGEFGVIKSNQFNSDLQDAEAECEDCQKYKVLSEPLENNLEPIELQTYQTLISDACAKDAGLPGFNFDINFPVKKMWVKKEKTGTTVYFTDFRSPPRYIVTNKLERYIDYQNEVCGDTVGPLLCFNADAMLIFQKFSIPDLTPVSIDLGGRLPQGTYQFLAAYADPTGVEISQYYALTNPIAIFDINNQIQAPLKETSELTNFAIKLQIEGLDKKHTHYKIAVIQNTDNAQTYVIEGLHTIDDNGIIYTTPDNKEKTDLASLLKVSPSIRKAEGLTVSSNALFLYGLEMEKEWNLQPVVNLMGQFLQWQTSIAKEDLYKDGVASALYIGYNREEVYPVGIEFELDYGSTTATFPFIGREATAEDLEEVAQTTSVNGNEEEVAIDSNNKDIASILANLPNCGTNGRTQRWQYYNDAKLDENDAGHCLSTEGAKFTTGTEVVEKSCLVSNVYTIPAGVIELPDTEEFTTLGEFIVNNNQPDAGYPFSAYMDLASYTGQSCFDLAGDSDCTLIDTPVEELIAEEIIGPGSAGKERVTKIEKTFPTEYAKIQTPQSVGFYVTGGTEGAPEVNTTFVNEFMGCNRAVFERVSPSQNTEIAYAEGVQEVEKLNSILQGYAHNYLGALTQTGLQTTKNTTALSTGWTNKIHKGALWFKGNTANRDSFILEVSKQAKPKGEDDAADGQIVRISIYNKANSSTPFYCGLIDLTAGGRYLIKSENGLLTIQDEAGPVSGAIAFTEAEFYVALDAKIITESVPIDRPNGVCSATEVVKYRTAPTDGAFSIVTRNPEYSKITIEYTAIVLSKKQTYNSKCTYKIPIAQSCKALPYKRGEFAYTQSIETYPDNEELFNSSTLQIKSSDFPDAENRRVFEKKFKKAKDNQGNYILKDSTDFRCTPIRHFKMPDNKVAPFMWVGKVVEFTSSVIFPLGMTINEEVIVNFLDIAVNNKLITQEQRDSITGYRIVRGDRTANKSVEASGYLYDMRNYTEKGRVKHYSNYPYNDLGPDKLNYQDDQRKTLNPHTSTGNYNFTFHSPETDFNPSSVPTELKVEGYIFGKSKGNFAEVEKHPKWVILGDKAKTVATLLAALESAAELAMDAAMAGQNYAFTIGLSSGANPVGAVLSAFATVVRVADAVRRTGEHRLEWLKTFRDLGSPKNFAYFYASEGHYNYLQTLQGESNLVRGINIGKQLKSGSFTTTNEITGERLEINNLDREHSTFISLGKDFPLVWDTDYSEFDNGAKDYSSSSLTFASESNINAEGRSVDVIKNIASPYVKLKNYIAAQYGTLGSIRWVSTGYKGDLKNPSGSCNSIFGGDTFITRYYLKRKVPMFVTDAMGLASLTPFDYKKYNNIGLEPRFYCDYELGGTQSGGSVVFPNLDSDYSFDSLTGRRDMYVKPPTKFYLYYYGVPGMLTESEINTNFRTGRKELEDNFYPQVGDIINWTQESEVSIKRPNSFFYNKVYSQSPTSLNHRALPAVYNKKDFDTIYDKPNGVYYSLQDNTENSLSDPWLIFRALNTFEFPTSYGKLKSLQGIENDVILGRFQDTVAYFNSTDVAVQGIAQNENAFGNGGIFSRNKPKTFSQTELGVGGTQSTESVSSEFGHFHVDAKRGQVMQIEAGKGPMEITGYESGLRNWFKEHLPFKILKSGISGIDTDNAYNGVGITMGWDSRFNRVFLTKKDYIPLNNNIEYVPGEGFMLNTSKEGAAKITTCPEGYTLNTETQLCEKVFNTEPLCPTGYTYNSQTNQCIKIETVEATCIPDVILECLADFEIIVDYMDTGCSTGHTCNAANFNLAANGIEIGLAQLSNSGGTQDAFNYPPGETSGTHRYSSFTLTTIQSQSIAEASVDGNITFALICATPSNVDYGYGLGGCHTSASHMVIKRNGVVIYDTCPNGNTFTINPCTGVVTP